MQHPFLSHVLHKYNQLCAVIRPPKSLEFFLKLENKISEQIKILGEEIVLKRRRSTSKISESLQVIFLISLIVTKETLI